MSSDSMDEILGRLARLPFVPWSAQADPEDHFGGWKVVNVDDEIVARVPGTPEVPAAEMARIIALARADIVALLTEINSEWGPLRWTCEVPDIGDDELVVIAVTLKALSRLEPHAQRRITNYLHSRFVDG